MGSGRLGDSPLAANGGDNGSGAPMTLPSPKARQKSPNRAGRHDQ
jgi:hypothetical protein